MPEESAAQIDLEVTRKRIGRGSVHKTVVSFCSNKATFMISNLYQQWAAVYSDIYLKHAWQPHYTPESRLLTVHCTGSQEIPFFIISGAESSCGDSVHLGSLPKESLDSSY